MCPKAGNALKKARKVGPMVHYYVLFANLTVDLANCFQSQFFLILILAVYFYLNSLIRNKKLVLFSALFAETNC